MPSFCLGTETGSAGRTLNRPLQTARFTFQALLGIRRARVWMGQLNLYMTSGKVTLAVACLVSLWRDTCNYNRGGNAWTAQLHHASCGPKMWPAEKSGGCGVSLLVICDLNQYYCEMVPAQVMSLWWLARTSVATLVGQGAKSFRAR